MILLVDRRKTHDEHVGDSKHLCPGVQEKEAAMKRERDEALKRAENDMTDGERCGGTYAPRGRLEFLAELEDDNIEKKYRWFWVIKSWEIFWTDFKKRNGKKTHLGMQMVHSYVLFGFFLCVDLVFPCQKPT